MQGRSARCGIGQFQERGRTGTGRLSENIFSQILVAVVLGVCLTLGLAQPLQAQTVTESREAAVRQARAGDLSGAIVALQRLLASKADDGRVAYDLVTLLQQADRSAEAADLFARTAKADAPDYALMAAARANRSLKRYGEAERLARQGMARFPGDPFWRTFLALVLTDADRPQDAIALLGPAGSLSVDRLLAQGYAYRRAGDLFAALKAYGSAARIAPGNREAQREMAGILNELGAPHAAERFGGTNPSIEASKAGALVRWGEDVRPRDPARRFEGTDRAIARLDTLLRTTTDPDIRRRLQDDRIVALRDRFRMDEVVQEVEAMKGERPTYIEEAYADALLYLHRPQEALAAYNRVLTREPRNVQARYGEFYSAVESEDFAVAYAVVDILLRDEPIWRSYPADPTRYPNPDRTVAELTDAKARFYAGDFARAWDRVSGMADAAPANADIRITAAHVAASRGWKRRAQEEAEIAASLAPDDRAAKLAVIDSLVAAYRFAEADRLMAELVALYPEDLSVQHTARALAAEHKWQLDTRTRFGNSVGGGVNQAGQELQSLNRLYSPPIGDNWRVFAMGNYAFAHPIEGFVSRLQAGAGAELRMRDLRAELFANQSAGTLGGFGAGGRIDWSITDQISVGASAELFTFDTPLRGLYYGITSNQVAVRAAYRWHEERNLGLVAAWQPFSDGNQRFSAGLAFEQRLVTVPHFWLTGLAALGVSSNTRNDVPYYSPLADLTATVGVLAEHTLWRSYDRSLVQALTVRGGLYSERGYGESWVGVAAYEHRWQFNPNTEFRYGVQFSHRTYDGLPVHELSFVIALLQRI